MPDIGAYHPIIVHFAIVLLIVGVIFRWVFLTGRAYWAGPAAATLLIAGTLAAVAAAQSGLDAHDVVERIPGARQAVIDHEEAGEWARDVFLVVAALEIIALVLIRRKPGIARGVVWGSAVLGLVGIATLYNAGDKGGDLVYAYAGGVGTRLGDTADVRRLYVAGLYQAAQQARRQNDSSRAAQLFAELAKQFPNDTSVRLLAAESLLRDKKDPRGALGLLAGFPVAPDNRFLSVRVGFLKSDAYVAAGKPDSARAVLQQLATAFPQLQQRIQDRLKNIR